MKEVLQFIEEIERLKFIPRSGWQYYGIKEPESVAEHSFLLTFLCLIVGLKLIKSGEDIDLKKLLIMSIIHEIGEVRIGDIHLIAKEYIGHESVEIAERKVAYDLLKNANLDELIEIYDEFLKGETKEAILVRACDKLELLIQAYLYKKIGYTNIDEFFNARKNIEDIEKIEILDNILREIRRLGL